MPFRHLFTATGAALAVLTGFPRTIHAAPPKQIASTPSGDVQGAERKAILNTVRTPVEADLKQKIAFRVTDLRVRNGWAFVEGEPLTGAGERPDYSHTKYAAVLTDRVKAGFLAILRQAGSAGKGWKMVHYTVGPEEIIATEPLETYTKPPFGAPAYVLFGIDTAHTPRGAERKTILDALRPPVEKDLKQKIVFQVDTLRVLNDWAFLFGAPLRPDGQKPDFRKTQHQDAIDNGAFDNNVSALLKRRGGKWTVVVFVIGATDVAWDGWDTKYHAPRALFPYRTDGPEKGAGLMSRETGRYAVRGIPNAGYSD